MNDLVQSELKKIFDVRFSTSISTRTNYARGEDTYDPVLSKAVVFPETNEEVSKVLSLCNKHKVPVVPFGTGTSLEGNVVGNEKGITISLEKKAHHKLIKDVKTNDTFNWRERIVKQLFTNFNIDFSNIYSNSNLVDINLNSINYCRQKLNIDTPLVLSSTLNIKTKGSQKLSDICNKLNATEYISGQGAKKYLDESIFNCKVSFFEPKVTNYYTTLQHI